MPGREQNDGGPALRGERTKRGKQRLAILLDGPHAAFSKQRREDLLHHLAAGQHVGDAAGHAQIIFEDHEPAVRQADQVSSDHADINVARNFDALHLPAEVFAGIDDFAGDYPVLQNAAVRDKRRPGTGSEP